MDDLHILQALLVWYTSINCVNEKIKKNQIERGKTPKNIQSLSSFLSI